MNCKEIEPLLYLVRDGELSLREREVVGHHLAACESCRQLYLSVVQMTNMIQYASFDYPMDSSVVIPMHRHRFWSVGKMAAAVVMLLLAMTFAIQEASFQKSRTALEQRLDKAAFLAVNQGSSTDCLDKLARRIRTVTRSALPTGDPGINRIDEEQLAQYINQVCGNEGVDAKSIRKLLEQSGLKRDNNH